MSRYAVIMAGGSGTRLWPLSRRRRPKQLLRIVEGRSLLRAAYDRLTLVLPPESIYVVALEEHLPEMARELPDLPRPNLIGEPTGRDTANAIALAAALLHARDPRAVMGVFTADQVIRPSDRFAEVVRRGYAAAEEHPQALITFGVKPTEPHTGYGYIEHGEPAGAGVWRVRTFKEKPDLETARRYVASGRFYWNSGMFVWRTETILDHFRRLLPETHSAMQRLAARWNEVDGPRLAAETYPSLRKISIDYAVLEKSESVLVVEMALEWLDVGHWTALPAVVGADPDGNTCALARSAMVASRGNIVVAEDEHLIALVGVEDLVVVRSGDATLICHREHLHRLKELTAELETAYEGLYG